MSEFENPDSASKTKGVKQNNTTSSDMKLGKSLGQAGRDPKMPYGNKLQTDIAI